MNPLLATRTLPHPLLAYSYPLPFMPDTTPPPAPSAASAPASPPPAETKGFACQWEGCDKSLPDPELLYIHLCNDHIGRKSTNNLCLTCKWKGCGATCAKRDHITSHLRVHTPLKPHVCEICNKPFKRPQDLKKHEKIHTEEHHMAHRHSKAITVHDENYIERVRAQAPNAAAPPRGLDLHSLHPSLAGLGLPGHNLAYLAGATATREQARSPTLASFAGVQHHNQYGPGLGEFGSVSPRSADEALTPASARISPMPPHADIGLGWDTPSLGKRGRNGSDPASPSDDFWSDAKKRRFQPTYDAQMAERLSTLSSLGFPPLGAAHPSLSLHPNAHSPPSTTGAVPPSLPIPDPRSAEELAQWNQYLVKLGEQVASSVYAHALGLAPPPPPPPQQYLDPTTLAQFGLAGMPGLLGLGLGLGGLPGLGMLGASGLGGVDYNAIAAYQQAQAQALAVQSQIAAGLYPGLDLASLAAAAAANPANVAAAAAAASASHDHADAKHSASPPRRPASSSSRRSASASESDFEFDALRPSRAPVSASGIPGLAGLPGFGAAGVSMGLGDKRSVVPLKSAPPPVKEEDEDADMDDADTTRFPPPAAPVEPRLGMRTPGMPAKIPATTGGSSGLYPTLPPSLASSSSSPSSSESSGEKIKLPGIQSLLEPSFRLRPVASSPSSSSENEDEDEDSNSTATSRAGSPSSQCGTVLPSFASIALSDSSRPVNKEVEERMRHIAVIQAMIVAVNKEWVAKHGPTQPLPPAEERKLEVSRDVEMVA